MSAWSAEAQSPKDLRPMPRGTSQVMESTISLSRDLWSVVSLGYHHSRVLLVLYTEHLIARTHTRIFLVRTPHVMTARVAQGSILSSVARVSKSFHLQPGLS